MIALANALLMVGGATTVTVAVLLVVPVPPSVDVMAPVVLLWTPAVVPFTFTEKLHEPLAAIVPPDRLTLPLPATAVIVPLPHVPLRPFGVATTRPPGRVSLKPTPLSATALGLLIVKVSEVVPFSGMVAAPNALLMVGGATTVSVSV